jgi:hypothetical protein
MNGNSVAFRPDRIRLVAFDLDDTLAPQKDGLRTYAAARLPGLEVRSGGSTSIDVTAKGFEGMTPKGRKPPTEDGGGLPSVQGLDFAGCRGSALVAVLVAVLCTPIASGCVVLLNGCVVPVGQIREGVAVIGRNKAGMTGNCEQIGLVSDRRMTGRVAEHVTAIDVGDTHIPLAGPRIDPLRTVPAIEEGAHVDILEGGGAHGDVRPVLMHPVVAGVTLEPPRGRSSRPNGSRGPRRSRCGWHDEQR